MKYDGTGPTIVNRIKAIEKKLSIVEATGGLGRQFNACAGLVHTGICWRIRVLVLSSSSDLKYRIDRFHIHRLF